MDCANKEPLSARATGAKRTADNFRRSESLASCIRYPKLGGKRAVKQTKLRTGCWASDVWCWLLVQGDDSQYWLSLYGLKGAVFLPSTQSDAPQTQAYYGNQKSIKVPERFRSGISAAPRGEKKRPVSG